MTIEDNNGLIPLQVASNQEVFELLPKYMGQKLISSLKADDNRLCDIREKVFIEGKDLMMTSILNEGVIIFVDCKSTDVLDLTKEYKTIKIIDIYDIREKSPTLGVVQGKFGVLEIRTRTCGDLILDLDKTIDYCHVNKIGYTFTPDSQIPLGLNQVFSRNVSFQKVSIASFKILTKVHATPYANYYSALNIDSSLMFLIKQVPKAVIRGINKISYFVRESKQLQHIRHNFISRLYYAFQSRQHLYYILDHCKHSLLTEIQAKPLTASVAKVYIAQIILALESLHSKDIVYRNLSLDNI